MADKYDDRGPTPGDDERDVEFDRILERSSLGTRGARALRKRVSNAQVEKIRKRFDGDVDDEQRSQDLHEWIGWLSRYIDGLSEIEPQGRALDFAENAADVWGDAIAQGERPRAPSPASLLLLEVARALIQLAVNAALVHGQNNEITRLAAQESLTNALDGVRRDAESWLETGLPTEDEFARRVEAVRLSVRHGQAALQQRQNEDDADDAEAQGNPYGAMLGYHDPNVDSAMIFTQICSLSKDELDRYADAYDRLKRMIDSELLTYVSDMSDTLISLLEKTLRDINERRLSLGDVDAADKRLQHIRNATVAFTSALHSHQTQTYWQAEQQFGDDSDEYRELTRLFHAMYDASDGYMLLYELRHVLLHLSIDAVYSNLTARLDGESIVELNISRYWMSRSSGLMEKKHKRDRFEALTSDPSVLDLIRDVQARFGDLQKSIDQVLYPNVAEDAATVRELIRRFNGRRGMYALQMGPGFTRRLWIPPYNPLAPRVLAFADGYKDSKGR